MLAFFFLSSFFLFNYCSNSSPSTSMSNSTSPSKSNIRVDRGSSKAEDITWTHDETLKGIRTLGLNAFIYISLSFFVTWIVWHLGMAWISYQFGIRTTWWSDYLEFDLTYGRWSKPRILAVFLIMPVLFTVGVLVTWRLTISRRLRTLRPLFAWSYLMMIVYSLGQIPVGLLMHKQMAYVFSYMEIPSYTWVPIAVPVLIVLTLIGRNLVHMIAKSAAHPSMLTDMYKSRYYFNTTVVPYCLFLILTAVLFVPKMNFYMLGIAFSGFLPVLTANFYGRHRFVSRTVKKQPEVKPALIFMGILIVVLIVMRAVKELGFWSFS
jgi:hypothetical protein